MNIEEFVNYYLQNYRHEVLLNPYNGLIEFAKVVQEKLMEEAVEGRVILRDMYDDRGKDIDFTIPDNLKIGDKVRIIILPKED